LKKLFSFFFLFISLQASAISITNDTTISGTWDLQGQILSISAKISGTGIIKNALIEANPFIQIFETSIALSGCRAREFSAMWYGASPGNPDNSEALQQSINTCINSMPLFIPGGVYIYIRNH
jgi:hypothetical protein